MARTRTIAKPKKIELSQVYASVRKGKILGGTTTKMLESRELYGNVITSAQGKYNFREEYTKRLVSEPMIWRYRVRDIGVSSVLEQVDIIANMPDGEFKTDLLISGDDDGSVRFYVVHKDTQEFHNGERITPDCAWPHINNEHGFAKSPGHLWRLDEASVNMSSSISCMKKFGKPGQHKILITTGESDTYGGSVSVLSLSDPLMLCSRCPMIVENLDEITSFNRTILTADCNSSGSQALIGTDRGAALVNVETGAQSWVCRCKCDVTSVQLDNSEKIALCGLQNGAIVSIDVRQRPDSHARLTRQRIYLHSRETGKSKSSSQNTRKRWFELRGSMYHSGTISTPSYISCLASLKLYDQYFLASSMDGSIKLYDHRMVQGGAVLSYEGNVNSGCSNLAVEPSEKYVMSGGDDRKVRLWSIKSGELLFEEMFMCTYPFRFCWGNKEDNCAGVGSIYNEHSPFGEAWVGTPTGLFLMRW